MRKLIVGFAALFSVINLFAQPTLNYDSHALKAGQSNPMTFCKFQDVGVEGPNQLWDYSGLVAIQEFTGLVNKVDNDNFAFSNIELNEFGARFYFDVNENGIYQTGYLSRSEKTSIVYSQAFQKVRFPLRYGELYSAPFTAEYFQNNELAGQIEGVGEVKADAWGTILLPGDTEFKNTIRIKTEKKYTLVLENSEREVEMITFRWYNSTHRYPLLVLTEINTRVKGDIVSIRTQAAYNSQAVNMALPVNKLYASDEMLVYPNPSNGAAFLTVNSDGVSLATISISGITGKEIVSTFSQELYAGSNKINISGYLNGIPEGMYLIQIQIDGEIINKELLVKR